MYKGVTLAAVVAGTLLSALAGCGFHLTGRTPLPDSMKSAYVQAADQQTDFVQSLRRALLTSGARPAYAKTASSSVVNILRDEVVRRTLSVSALNKPNEYEVTYYVRFSVSAGDKELLAAQEMSATRSYSFDETRLLAKEHEEAILRQAMAHDLADRVVRQLSSL
ncbi:MAG: LPS assembly lipoprotein LptE [Steroidobacteraceae bacterium]